MTLWLRTEFILPFAGASIDSCLNSICQNVAFFSLTFKVTQGNSCFTCAWQLDLHPACPNIFGSSGKQMVIAAVFKPIFMQGEIGNGGRIRSLCAPMFHAQTFFFFLLFVKKVSTQMGCSLSLFTSVVVVVCAWTCQFCVLSLRQRWLVVSRSVQMSAPNKQTLNWTNCLWILVSGLSL